MTSVQFLTDVAIVLAALTGLFWVSVRRPQ